MVAHVALLTGRLEFLHSTSREAVVLTQRLAWGHGRVKKLYTLPPRYPSATESCFGSRTAWLLCVCVAVDNLQTIVTGQ